MYRMSESNAKLVLCFDLATHHFFVSPDSYYRNPGRFSNGRLDFDIGISKPLSLRDSCEPQPTRSPIHPPLFRFQRVRRTLGTLAMALHIDINIHGR